MKLPNFRRIITGDYEEEYTELVDTLSVSINQGITSLYDALNKKVSLKYNILCTTKDITVQVDQQGYLLVGRKLVILFKLIIYPV